MFLQIIVLVCGKSSEFDWRRKEQLREFIAALQISFDVVKCHDVDHCT